MKDEARQAASSASSFVLPPSTLRMWVRLLLTTLGRGGEGQRVRDEILHIMHRNNLKELSGTFVEEWHQKLHNNTTPDDVVICSAYLAFLRSNGDLKPVLPHPGSGRRHARTAARDSSGPSRPIPSFWPTARMRSSRSLRTFLQILKAVHSGTDLESAAATARGRLGPGPKQKLDAFLSSRQTRRGRLADLATCGRVGASGAKGRRSPRRRTTPRRGTCSFWTWRWKSSCAG